MFFHFNYFWLFPCLFFLFHTLLKRETPLQHCAKYLELCTVSLSSSWSNVSCHLEDLVHCGKSALLFLGYSRLHLCQLGLAWLAVTSPESPVCMCACTCAALWPLTRCCPWFHLLPANKTTVSSAKPQTLSRSGWDRAELNRCKPKNE